MNKTVIAASSILAAGAVACMVLYLQSTRFAVVNSGRGAVYRVDRQTGGASVLFGTRQLPVEDESKRPATKEYHWKNTPRAILLAKSSHTLDGRLTNEAFLLSSIKSNAGLLDSFWNAEHFDGDIYIVSLFYQVPTGNEPTWGRTRMEVDVQMGRVREIDDEEKYKGW